MHISQFPFKETVIELTFNNGFLAWTFEFKGETYGTKVKVPSKKTLDVASITAGLILNAIATYEDLS